MGQNRKGGIAGSYPIWGMYCPLKYPSWAAKYFIDLSILIKKYIRMKLDHSELSKEDCLHNNY